MKILLIDNGSNHLKKILSFLKDNEVTQLAWNELENIKPAKFDLIILSGGHELSVLYNKKELASEIELIKKSDKPVLGICLGCEIIAHVFGAKINQLERREEGLLEIDLIKDDLLFENLNELKGFEAHRWAITELSKELLGLAKSKDGYEIIKHIDKPIYGIQFHPEITPEVGGILINNFLNLTEKELQLL